MLSCVTPSKPWLSSPFFSSCSRVDIADFTGWQKIVRSPSAFSFHISQLLSFHLVSPLLSLTRWLFQLSVLPFISFQIWFCLPLLTAHTLHQSIHPSTTWLLVPQLHFNLFSSFLLSCLLLIVWPLRLHYIARASTSVSFLLTYCFSSSASGLFSSQLTHRWG